MQSPATAGVCSTSLDSDVSQLVQQIHATPTKAVLYVTGGGAAALTWLLGVPGASNTVLDARIPYATASLAELLGAAPATSASAETAETMARAAYRQAANLTAFGAEFVGCSCTCALATDRVKKGDHKVHVAVHSGCTTHCYSLVLAKGARSRTEEEAVASRLLLRALAAASGLSQACQLSLRLLGQPAASAATPAPEAAPATEQMQEQTSRLGDPLEALLAGRVRTAELVGACVVVDAPRAGRVYLPGSFHPLHEGHRQLLAAAVAVRGPGAEGCFELSVGNADKGLLPLEEVRRRAAQFTAEALPLVITQAPLFTQKAELFPNSWFVVGYDTAIRLVDPKYYGGETGMLLQFAALRFHGCGFLVAGRRTADGSFCTLDDVLVPEALQGLFQPIPEFRADISSTELRQRHLANQQTS